MIFLGWNFSKINADIFGCKKFINSNIMRNYGVNWLLKYQYLNVNERPFDAKTKHKESSTNVRLYTSIQ